MGSRLFGARSAQELFADEAWLYPEFLPAELPHRESELKELALALQPAAKGRRADNVFCFGPTGTGKTASVRFVVRELSEFAKNVKSLYLNGFEHGTRHAALSAIANFFSVPVPRRGVGTDEVLNGLRTRLDRVSFNAVLVLDEADQWARDPAEQKLFYDLSRAQELAGMKLAVVLISNEPDLLLRLEDRMRSSLGQSRLEFAAYSPAALKDILRARATHAFRPGAVDADAINVAAAVGARNGGDCRLAIQALLKAGRLAEKENASSVSADHVSRAVHAVVPRPIEKAAPFLSPDEKTVLALVGASELSAGELYQKYAASVEAPLSSRSFRDILTSLTKNSLVRVRLASKGRRGRTRLVRKI